MKKTFLIFYILLINFVAAEDTKYIDVVMSNSFIGDNVLNEFPKIGAMIEHCQKQIPKCKVRAWMSKENARLFRGNSDKLVVESIPRSWRDSTEQFVRDLPLDRIKESSLGVYISNKDQDIVNGYFEKIDSKKIAEEINKKIGGSGIVAQELNIDSKLNTPNNYHTIDGRLTSEKIPGIDADFSNRAPSQWRQQVAQYLVPPDAEDIVSRETARFFGDQADKPNIFMNFTTSKIDTDLIENGVARQMIEDAIAKNGDLANIVIAPIGDSKASPEAKKAFQDFILEMEQKHGIKLLPEDALSKGVVDSFIASKKTISIVSADTGLYHIAAAVRGDDPRSVTGVFPIDKVGNDGRLAHNAAAELWGAPRTNTVHLFESGTEADNFRKGLMSSRPEGFQRALDGVSQNLKDNGIMNEIKSLICK